MFIMFVIVSWSFINAGNLFKIGNNIDREKVF
jgi:hypothetical protein